jgi:iron complex outermembrane receptor protein
MSVSPGFLGVPKLIVGLWLGAAIVWAQQSPRGAAIPPNSVPSDEAVFGEIPVVEAATLRLQTLEDAPANVTVITATDIRKYGYRTLGEALASARGFYSSYDRIYTAVGQRGFSIPGDYNTRFLIMINGHVMTEVIYNESGFFGQDFGLDMDLVQRIEIVRGPSSVLYGSNGIFGNINIVTKSPVDTGRAYATTETGTLGEKKAMIATSLYLGRGANLLVSGSVFNNAGGSVYMPEFESPANNRGLAVGVDGQRGYHSFANLVWKNWSVLAYFNSRQKHAPISWGDSIFADRGGALQERRNFVQAGFTRDLGKGKLRWRTYYDEYFYSDRWDYQRDSYVEDDRSNAAARWLGTQLNWTTPLRRIGLLTIGLQADFEIRNVLEFRTVQPVAMEWPRISHPDRSYGVFMQQEIPLSRRLKATLGLRFNDSQNYGDFLSPQAALVFQPGPKTVYKLTYGRSFRNPSAFEQYSSDVNLLASGGLQPETGHSLEVSVERKRRQLSFLVNGFFYFLDDVIRVRDLPEGVQQFVNLGSDRSAGVEFEMRGKLGERLEMNASLALQQAIDRHSGVWLSNSPRYVPKIALATPLIHNRLEWSGALRMLGPRETSDGQQVRRVVLVDTTWTTERLHRNFDVQFGIRNLLDWHYDDPIDLIVKKMPQDGRTAFLKLIWHWE